MHETAWRGVETNGGSPVETGNAPPETRGRVAGGAGAGGQQPQPVGMPPAGPYTTQPLALLLAHLVRASSRLPPASYACQTGTFRGKKFGQKQPLPTPPAGPPARPPALLRPPPPRRTGQNFLLRPPRNSGRMAGGCETPSRNSPSHGGIP